jgi:hypothetical protein
MAAGRQEFCASRKPEKSLFRLVDSLFRSEKIPVPPGTGNGVQTSENTGEIRPEKSPKAASS